MVQHITEEFGLGRAYAAAVLTAVPVVSFSVCSPGGSENSRARMLSSGLTLWKEVPASTMLALSAGLFRRWCRQNHERIATDELLSTVTKQAHELVLVEQEFEDTCAGRFGADCLQGAAPGRRRNSGLRVGLKRYLAEPALPFFAA
jgi:hypothetical protein